MPPRSWNISLIDIIEAIEKIFDYVEGMTFEQFNDDPKTIDAVIRNITVMGEAAKNLPANIAASYPDLPWQEMRAIRNIVVHEYFGVDNRVIWDTIQNNFPPLLPELKKLI